MTRFAIALTSALALAACQSGPAGETDQVPEDEGADEVVGALLQPLRPGLWELRETVGDVASATISSEEREEIEADPANRGAARTVCLPPDYADRPPAAFWAGNETPCSYDEVTMTGGVVTATISCNATPGSLTLTIDGEYDETALDVASTSARRGTGADDVTVNGRIRGEWRGECEAEVIQSDDE